jgi:predicted methyltransferase
MHSPILLPMRLPVRWSAALVGVVVSAAAGCSSTGGFGGRSPVLGSEQIAAIVASPDRSAADRSNDVRRKPVELLTFIGVRPGMTALDVSAGAGYTSELLARAAGPTGHVYGQSPPPRPDAAGVTPARSRSATLLDARAKNPAVASLVAVAAPFDNPVPPNLAPQSVDVVTLFFNYHDFESMGVDRGAMNRALFAVLKPGGVYVIADHAGRPGTGISESATLHRVEESFVVREVEAAGFRLAARGEFLHNPDDPRDREDPLPPQAKDEFVLKFVRP